MERSNLPVSNIRALNFKIRALPREDALYLHVHDVDDVAHRDVDLAGGRLAEFAATLRRETFAKSIARF